MRRTTPDRFKARWVSRAVLIELSQVPGVQGRTVPSARFEISKWWAVSATVPIPEVFIEY